jgi:hypothetical protein
MQLFMTKNKSRSQLLSIRGLGIVGTVKKTNNDFVVGEKLIVNNANENGNLWSGQLEDDTNCFACLQ